MSAVNQNLNVLEIAVSYVTACLTKFRDEFPFVTSLVSLTSQSDSLSHRYKYKTSWFRTRDTSIPSLRFVNCVTDCSNLNYIHP